MNMFVNGKIKPMNVDYAQYNEDALNRFIGNMQSKVIKTSLFVIIFVDFFISYCKMNKNIV